jgi:transcription-repair coupling factor (superfamily II helicase)
LGLLFLGVVPVHQIIDLLTKTTALEEVARYLADGHRQLFLHGVTDGFSPFLLSAMQQRLKRPLLIIVPDLYRAEGLHQAMASLGGRPLLFPPSEFIPYEVLASDDQMCGERIKTITHLVTDAGTPVVIAPVRALQRRLPPVAAWQEGCFALQVDASFPITALTKRLVALGYHREDAVIARGQFSVRGGIVDVFPFTAAHPYRIEFFGDEISSIRWFETDNQRSQGETEQALIGPANEIVLDRRRLEEGVQRLQAAWTESEKRIRITLDAETGRDLEERVTEHLQRMKHGWDLTLAQRYLPFFYPETAFLAEYFPQPPLVIIEHPQRVQDVLQRGGEERMAELLEHGQILPEQVQAWLSPPETWEMIQSVGATVSVMDFLSKITGMQPDAFINCAAREVSGTGGNPAMLKQRLQDWMETGHQVVAFCNGQARRERLVGAWQEEGLPLRDRIPAELAESWIVVAVADIGPGFELPNERIVVLTEQEIFLRPHKRTGRARQVKPGLPAVDLKVGDYVVHVNHGIGQYQGVQTLEVEGAKKDYLFIRYAGQDRLYVPTEHVGLITKYAGSEGEAPRLNRLGGTEWIRTKKKVKESIKQMARELLELYSVREVLQGYAFGPDTPWQREFEEAFPYNETPDQMKATQEIKADMERARPMDRLLCGDVGYGKTEVAMRAVFKAVLAGKQVAVLVPTTILAHQHFQTFQERFAAFPVRIEMLSRFRTTQEQEKIIQACRTGELDVVIGTHRLLQPDVVFKDLGLLVVDEEQRFGVGHKERLKQMRRQVDVLTLSATPIPRTLHMSLVGIRDMSLIETPPENRFPVETFVVEYDPALIKDVLRRELRRGGQVYYVHNRVQTIDAVAAQIARLVPESRVAIAHGQMREEHLEKIMTDFLAGEYDILVCTTIIESGLDIANVNTLIVEDSDRFGLAQLYQLRGRVGRSDRLAYAYFTFRRDKVLSEVAQKRLQAIREFTEFGAGLKIALRDLEIRGAGNILGPEQHGFIVSVGFDLYCRLMEEAIREVRGEPLPPRAEPAVVDLALDAFIDQAYIQDASQKIEAYQKIAAAKHLQEIEDIRAELQDRFGSLPKETKNLLGVAKARLLSEKAGVEAISQQRYELVLRFSKGRQPSKETVIALRQAVNRKLTLSGGQKPQLKIRVRDLSSALTGEEILALLDVLLTCLVEMDGGE